MRPQTPRQPYSLRRAPLPGAPLLRDPAVFNSISDAAEAAIKPANDLERLLTRQTTRNCWRSIRLGNLESAAIDVEMADHQQTVEDQWGKVDPESLYHLTTRRPETRAAIREFSTLESAATRRTHTTLLCLKDIRKLR